jgi:hypothetical protein
VRRAALGLVFATLGLPLAAQGWAGFYTPTETARPATASPALQGGVAAPT